MAHLQQAQHVGHRLAGVFTFMKTVMARGALEVCW